MNEPEITLADTVAESVPAEDVTDLDTARRLVTRLRETITRMVEEGEPIAGEYTIFLDEKHDHMLNLLYEKGRLSLWHVGDESDEGYWDDPPEIDEAVTDFVQGCVEIAWDMAHEDQDSGQHWQRPSTA